MTKVIKPTTTINQLHFEDLSPSRFEDMCQQIIYKTSRWFEINLVGQSGSDDGIDISAIEELPNGNTRKWFVQCKKYMQINWSELKDTIDKVIKKELPDVFLLVVSCSVTKRNLDKFKAYAIEKGIKSAQVWTKKEIETRLYSDCHDILFAYFGIDLSRERNKKMQAVKRNISLRKRMKKDFLRQVSSISEDERWQRIKNPNLRFNDSEFLIRSIDDVMYPHENEADILGNYGWFKVESWDFYYNGLKVITSCVEVLIDSNQRWELKEEYVGDIQGLKEIVVFQIGNIPFNNIVEYNIDGDEFYIYPHIFCDFSFNGTPYEGYDYYFRNGESSTYLDNEMRGIIFHE